MAPTMLRRTFVVLGAILSQGVLPVESSCQQETQMYSSGDVTILTYNDLDNTPDPGTAAILVHQPLTFSAAEFTCDLLHETLWASPEADTFFTGGLNSSLSYQIYLENFPSDQVFWIAKAEPDSPTCRAIDIKGGVSNADCETQLPTLCTQSAPVSTQDTKNTSAVYQVDQPVKDLGLFRGYRDFFVWKFHGIRYATPPERFSYAKVYEETRDIVKGGGEVVPAFNQGADCLQPIGEVKSGASEDCLFLNIWTPWLPPTDTSNVPKEKLKPVMFYIYGGGFRTGSGKNPNTDGTMISSRGDVVAVSVNYRVGAMGFLAFNDGVHKGNYGLADIVTALEWVSKHIKAFGGDPDRVTIYGGSAGAIAVRALLGSPKAKGLFSNAISLSGPIGWSTVALSDNSEALANLTLAQILDETGCATAADQFECLKTINGTELVNTPTAATTPVFDGTYLLADSLSPGAGGYSKDVAVMTGIGRNEHAIDMDMPETEISVPDFFAQTFGPAPWVNVSEVLRSGKFGNPSPADLADVFNATERIKTDGEYTCLEAATAYSAVKHEAFLSFHSFLFNRTYSPTGYTKPHCGPAKTADRPNGDPDLEYYKCHAGDQMIVFGTVRRDLLPDRDGLDVPFMQLIIDYWTSFARTRNPNPSKAYLVARDYWGTLAQIEAVGEWKPVSLEKPEQRLLQWNGRQAAFSEREQCDVLGFPIDFFESGGFGTV